MGSNTALSIATRSCTAAMLESYIVGAFNAVLMTARTTGMVARVDHPVSINSERDI
jgi:hypothetical protein